jgi:hypothetical protein
MTKSETGGHPRGCGLCLVSGRKTLPEPNTMQAGHDDGDANDAVRALTKHQEYLMQEIENLKKDLAQANENLKTAKARLNNPRTFFDMSVWSADQRFKLGLKWGPAIELCEQ